MDNYIDFMLLNQYAGNMDWDNHNWYAIYNKKKGKGFWFLSWDAETIFGDIDDNITSINYPNCPSSFFQKLIKSPSFMHKYIDRAHFLFSENGYLSPDYTSVVLDSLYDKIKFAIYAESARWGDYRKNVHTLDTINETYTADFHYIKERDRLRNVYLPNRTDIFKRQLQENGWYPQIEAPVMFANGRKVENGSVVNAEVLSFDTSKVYYTFDGTDPISWESDKNGVVSENTYIWEEGDYVSLPMGSVIIKAITNNGIEWSPTVTYKITNTNDTSISHLVIDKQEVSSTYNLSGQKVKSIGCGIIVTKGKKIISKD